MQTKRLILFHQDTVEAVSRVRELKRAGYKIERRKAGPLALRDIRENSPAAVIIDLSRAPNQGRDIGIYIRHYKSTRNIPIVFVNGEPEKVARIKKHLPDATFAEWNEIRDALKRAIRHPPAKPCAPKSLLAGYSDTPLVKKLGIKPKSAVVFINVPCNVEKILPDLPEGVVIRRRLRKKSDMIIWFVELQRDMQRRIRKIVSMIGNGCIWIAWPKKNSVIPSDLSQKTVRDVGLDAGLVDYKVCSIDETWSGLKFARRK